MTPDNDDKIVQEVELQGENEVVAGYERIGAAGRLAMDEVAGAATKAGPAVASAGEAAAAASAGTDTLAKSTAKAAASMTAGARAAAELRTALAGEAAAAAEAAAANSANAEATASATVSAKGFATALGLIGRLTRTRELTQFGRALRTLSSGFAALAAPVAAIVIERIASSAATAASKVDDLAIASKQSAAQFQDLAAAGTAAGVSNEDFGKALDGVGKMLAEGAEKQSAFDDKMKDLNNTIVESRKKMSDLGAAFFELQLAGQRSFRALRIAQQDFNQSVVQSAQEFLIAIRSIEEQRQEILNGGVDAETKKARQLRDLDERQAALEQKQATESRKRLQKQIELIEHMEDARRKLAQQTAALSDQEDALLKQERDARAARQKAIDDFERTATGLQKLGITSLDTNGKLKQSGPVFEEIADKLKALPEGFEKAKIRAELLAAGISGPLLRALEGGAASFKKLEEAGKNIRPPFTDAQIALSRSFLQVSDQLVSSMAALKDAFGLAVAPAFLGLMEKLRDIFITIRPGVEAFGRSLGNILGPILNGIAIVIQQFVIPVIQGFFRILDEVAQTLNHFLGTSLTGTDLFAAALIGLAAAFAPIPVLITLAIAALGILFETFKENKLVLSLVGIAIGGLILAFATIPVIIAIVIAAILLLAAKWDAIKEKAGEVTDFMRKEWEAFGTWFSTTWVGQIIGAIKEVLIWLGKLQDKRKEQNIGGDKIRGAGAAEGFSEFARGGYVRGPGTTTSDSILARVSKGEYIIRAAAVARMGLARLNAINAMRMPKFNIPSFSMGGLVEAMSQPVLSIPRFADGGQVQMRAQVAGRPIVLNIGGETFDVVSQDADTADRMVRFASKRRLASTGRKASYYGNGR